MEDVKFIKRDLYDNDWIGVVIDNNDITFSGRAKIRVFGVFDDIVDEHIPWASPVNSTIFASNGGGSLSIPKKGMFVRVQFNNGDIYAPEYLAIQNVDTNLIEEIKEDYIGTHVISYDPEQNLKIIFQRTSGLMVFFKDSFFQITPDSMITLQHADSDSLIQMEGDITRIVTKNEVQVTAAAKVTVSADEVVINGANTTKVGSSPYSHALLAEPFFALLTTLATALDAKLPSTPGINAGLVESAKQAITSTNVLIGR